MEDEESLIEVVQLKQWMEENREALQNAGIAIIVGEYQGEGDEGRFDGTHALDGQGLHIDYDLPQEIADRIESLADQLATPHYEDGEGGGGEIRLNVSTGSIVHEAYDFVTQRSSHEEETF
jgi:hypothetical protein